MQGNGKKKKKNKKQTNFICMEEGKISGAEWSIQFCQGIHSLLWHQYSAKIVTLWYLLYFLSWRLSKTRIF